MNGYVNTEVATMTKLWVSISRIILQHNSRVKYKYILYVFIE